MLRLVQIGDTLVRIQLGTPVVILIPLQHELVASLPVDHLEGTGPGWLPPMLFAEFGNGSFADDGAKQRCEAGGHWGIGRIIVKHQGLLVGCIHRLDGTQHKGTGHPVAGSIKRSSDYFAATASQTLPSWNLTPSRRVKVTVFPSSDIFQLVARLGCGPFSSITRKGSWICTPTSMAAIAQVNAGSRLFASVLLAILIVPPLRGAPGALGTGVGAGGAAAGIQPAATEALAATARAADVARLRNRLRLMCSSLRSSARLFSTF